MTSTTAHLLADGVVLVHFGFVLFVVAGGLMVLRWPRAAWFHLPCLVWGATIEIGGGVCPLTPLENSLRVAAGLDTYAGGFVARYVLPVLYPGWLDRPAQWGLAAALLVLNAAVYGFVWHRLRSRRRLPPATPGGDADGRRT